MIIVTGGAGFIGSNLVYELNRRGHDDIVIVDDMSDGRKFSNIVDADIVELIDKDDFRLRLRNEPQRFLNVNCVFHLGACSDTTEWDGRFMLDNNYTYSRELLDYCQQHAIPFVYASSAAVYGGAQSFAEVAANERPLNVYGYSKLLFDRHVRKLLPQATAQIAGLRYFNVYGPRETHKQKMASVAYHFDRQLRESNVVKLFEGSHGYDDGAQLRDFIHVDDAVKVTLWLADHPNCSGIFNCGTGRAAPFNAVANAVLEYHQSGEIQYIPFPGELKAAYQSYTEADLANLKAAGYEDDFLDVSEGVKRYLDWLAD